MAITGVRDISLSDFEELMINVHVPSADAVIVEGPVGASKSSRAVQIGREFQDVDPQFGTCYFNCSGRMSVDMFGWAKNSPGPLSLNGVPTLLQPLPERKLRGAFPVLCADDMMHADYVGERLSLTRQQMHDGTLTFDMLRPFERGLIIIDEATKAQHESMQACISGIAEDKQVGDIFLPKQGWAVLIITNNVDDLSGDFMTWAHLNTRVVKYRVSCGVDDMLSYWRSIGMHPMFLGFAKAEPQLVIPGRSPKDGGQFSTVRGWTYAEANLTSFCQNVAGIPAADETADKYTPAFLPFFDGDSDPNIARLNSRYTPSKIMELAHQLLVGRVGPAVAIKFEEYVVHLSKAPTYEEIVADPARVPVPSHGAAVHTLIEMCAQRAKTQDLTALVTWAQRLGKPMLAIFAGAVAHKLGPAAMNNPAYMKLISLGGDAVRSNVLG